jgi:hypothetical protein
MLLWLDMVGNINLDEETLRHDASSWWRNICSLDVGTRWFSNAVKKRVGNGRTIRFWRDVWVAGLSLQERFPRLFSISNQQDAMLSDVGWWEDGVWNWRLLWRRNFFVWEETLLLHLRQVLAQVTLLEAEDRWMWIPRGEDVFSVKSMYVCLDTILLNHVTRSPTEDFAFKFIWKSGAPSKVCAMAWQLLLNRIPTRDNLCYRGVIRADEVHCPWCVGSTETAVHAFLHCRFAAAVWYAITRWLGAVTVLPPTVVSSYAIFVGYGSNKKRKKCHSMIWLAFIWGLWKYRNGRIFNNKPASVDEVVDYIQRLSWKWFLSNIAKNSCLLYEWIWNPGDSMLG